MESAVSLDPELVQRLDRVRPALAFLNAFDPEHEVFGADTHHYLLAPPLSEGDLARFERTRGVALPREYRTFLAHAGGSGAGPYYGLSPLEPPPDASPPDAADDDAELQLDVPRPPDPARPFVLDGANPLPAGANALDGCLHLAEQGCGYASYLVLQGAHVGEVWDDFRAADRSVVPARLGFLTWYERWLAEAGHDAAANAALEAVLEGETSVDARVLQQIPRFDEDCARHPTCAIGHARRGFVLLHARRLADAAAAFMKALELNPACTHARLGLAANQAAHRDHGGALGLVDALLAEKGHAYLNRTHALTLRASVLRAAGRAQEAREAEEALLAHAGRRPFYHLEHALRLARTGDIAGAEATIRVAERHFEEEGLGGLDEWLHRLATRCAVKGRADLAADFEARAAAARGLPRARGADRRSWPEGPIGRHFFP